jgi:hypothetical protein
LIKFFKLTKSSNSPISSKSNRPSITSDFDNSSSKLFLNRQRLSLPLANANEDKLKIKRNSLPHKLPTTNTSENDVNSRKVSFTSSTNGSTISKRRNSSINFQFSPYIFRKLSMSELKVRSFIEYNINISLFILASLIHSLTSLSKNSYHHVCV